MIIEYYKDGKEVTTYNINNETDVFKQAKRCLKQLNLHPKMAGTIFGNSNGVILTVDAGNFHKFYIYK